MPKPKKQNPPTASKAPEVHTNEEDVFDDDEPDSQLSSVHGISSDRDLTPFQLVLLDISTYLAQKLFY